MSDYIVEPKISIMARRKLAHRVPKRLHPFLCTAGSSVIDKRTSSLPNMEPVRTNRHHLYPKNRIDIKGINREKFILRLWEYRHWYGWNILFQYCYLDHSGKKHCSELTIDEIITFMITKHPLITSKVGSRAWKILFREKTLQQATDLLCRMLSMKFNHSWKEQYPAHIERICITPAVAA